MSPDYEMVVGEPTPKPVYYKGYAIWAAPLGFVTCERLDTSNPETNSFGNIETAVQFIDDEIKRRSGRNYD